MQAKASTLRQIFARAAASLNFPSEKLFHIQKILYGITEAELHWFCTYNNRHRFQLCLPSVSHDQCFLYTMNGISSHFLPHQRSPRWSTCLQTDDTACFGNSQFISPETKISSRFASMGSVFLKDWSFVQFNGVEARLKRDTTPISQLDHISKLKDISEQNNFSSELVSQ